MNPPPTTCRWSEAETCIVRQVLVTHAGCAKDEILFEVARLLRLHSATDPSVRPFIEEHFVYNKVRNERRSRKPYFLNTTPVPLFRVHRRLDVDGEEEDDDEDLPPRASHAKRTLEVADQEEEYERRPMTTPYPPLALLDDVVRIVVTILY